MTEEEKQALSALRFDWATTPDDVWRNSPFHVSGLHSYIAQSVLSGIRDAKASVDSSPIRIALQGQKGVGKTHLLGWVREKVQSEDGYFFLVSLLDGNAFWESTVLSVFRRIMPKRRWLRNSTYTISEPHFIVGFGSRSSASKPEWLAH